MSSIIATVSVPLSGLTSVNDEMVIGLRSLNKFPSPYRG